jgi:hypothetical protein
MNDSGQDPTHSRPSEGETEANPFRPRVFHMGKERGGEQFEANREHTTTLPGSGARVAR